MLEFFMSFLRQKAPAPGKEIPLYYRRALILSESLMAVYFMVCFFLYPLLIQRWEWFPLLFVAVDVFGLWLVRHRGVRENLFLYSMLSVAWVIWNVSYFGWSCGVQHLLTLLLIFVFFNVYDRPVLKIIWFFLILALRIFLFYLMQSYPSVYTLERDANTIYQTVNTVTFFVNMAGVCIIFSTNIQDTERQLRLKNQDLYKEAGTDPLTGLPNRRSMIEKIEKHCSENPDEPFCVAIADIDLFKKVNDTYGHNCGDYTLVKLTELFVEHSLGRYSVCRWGGEEFCFFIPGMNLDEAGFLMKDLSFAVEKMKLNYDEHEFSITITIGVEEYDFSSPLEELLNQADEKLYMGKNSGRNKVVV